MEKDKKAKVRKVLKGLQTAALIAGIGAYCSGCKSSCGKGSCSGGTSGAKQSQSSCSK